MLESIVGSILNRFLGEYFENFSSANVNVGLWNGDAKVENLRMTHNALKTALNLPLAVTNGHLQTLELAIPWKNLGGEPTIMKLDGLKVEALVTDSVEHSAEDELRAKQKLLDFIETKLDAEAVVESTASNSEAYTNKVLKNLQVEIQNIEVKITDTQLGSTLGLSLGSLTLKTADTNWQEVGVMDHTAEEARMFKIAKLENLAIYINSAENEETEPAYILEPLTVLAHLQHNLKPGDDELRGEATIDLQSIGLRLTSPQFRFVTSSIEKLERIRRNAKFRKGRPDASTKEDAKAWWRYAGNTVIQMYKIKEKTKLFNRKYITEYCQNRKKYREMFKQKIQGTRIDQSDYDALESVLDIPTVIELRQKARSLVRKQTSQAQSSWFGGWFGSAAADDEAGSSLEIEEEDRNRISSILDGVDLTKSKDPPGVTRYKLQVSLPLLKIQLGDIMTISLEEALFTMKTIPGCKSETLQVKFERLLVDSKLAKAPIVTTNTSDGEFFSFVFTTNPFVEDSFEKIADRLLVVKSSGIEVKYDDDAARAVSSFFHVGDGMNEVRQVIQDEYIQRYEQSRAGMSYIISTRKVFLIDIDLKAPRVEIPGPEEQFLELNFGRLLVKSRRAKVTSLAEFDQSRHSLDQLQDMVYASYDVKLVDLTVAVRKRPTISDHELLDIREILAPLSINFELQRLDSKAQATVELAKFKVKGQLDQLKLNFSDYRMAQVSIIFSTIRRAWRAHRRMQEDISDYELPDAPIFIPQEQVHDVIEIAESYSNIKLPTLEPATSQEEFFDANDDSFTTVENLPVSYGSSSLADSAAMLKVSFALNSIQVQLSRETPEILLVDGQIRKVEFTLKQTKFTTDVDGQFEAVNLLFKPDIENESLNLISLGAPNQPAVEMNYAENRLLAIPETDIRFEAGSVRGSVDPQAINEISGFIYAILNASTGSDSSIDRGNSLLSRDSSISSASMNFPETQGSSESIMNIVVCSKKFDIDLYSKRTLIAQLYLSNGEVAFVTRENQTLIKTTVGGVKVVDPNAQNPLYRNVLTVVDNDSTFFDMSITLYDVDLSRDANNVEAVQGSVYLRTGSIKLIFFQKWIDYLAFYYPEEFATGPVDWDFIKSKDGSFLMSKYLLDVEIKDPIVIIPASTTQVFGFRGDVRNVRIRNSFKTISTTGHKFYPLFNNMKIDVEDLCLYHMPAYCGSTTKLSTTPILDESLTIYVESSSGWDFYKDIPGLIVNIDIDNATAHLNREDMVALWCCLNGNIWIRYDPKVAEEEAQIAGSQRRTGRFLSMVQSEETSLSVDETTSAQDDSFEEAEIHIDMVANVRIKTLAAKIYVKEKLYSSLVSEDLTVEFTSKTNLVTFQDIVVQDILLYDEREVYKNVSGESNCLLQKQIGIADPVITIKIQNFTKPAKQITDMDVKSMRMVVIMDFILNLKDIFADTMYEPVVFECTPRAQNLDVHQIHAHMQFQAKMDRPHIILMSDLKNAQDSSCIKLSADLRVVYIASLTEQNLDICIDQPQIYSVSFKNSFGNDEVYFGHKILNSEVNIAFNQLTSPRSNMIVIKCPELDITFNPEAINTLYLSYEVAMGPKEEVKEPEKVKICLDVQQTVDPKELWFVPNPLGTDVDSSLSLEIERMKRAEQIDELFSMNIPYLTVRLESIMSGSLGIAESQVVPLLVLNSSLEMELRNWSSEMFADISMKLDAEIYHESRPGYEPFIEQAESNLNQPDSKLVPFALKLKYQACIQSDRGHVADDDDGFAVLENNPNNKLVISSEVPLNMNVSSEGIDVLNHLATVYGHSLSDAAKGTLADAPKRRRTKLHNSEVKAPIIVINETGNDLILSTKDWIEFDPNQAKTDIRRNSLTRIKGKKPSDIKLHPVPRGSPRPEIMSFSIPSSTPRYFQFGRHIHVRSLSAYMIGLSPVGFSNRQIDVSALQENAYIFVANNNPAFKVILVVKVEGVTGARKITIQSSVTITNEIPFPLELINGAQARWQVNDETRNAPMPIKMMNSACIMDVTFADPDVSVADNLIVYSTKTSFSTRLQLSVKKEAIIHHMTAQVKRIPYKRSSLYKINIRFCPVFSLTNWLPYPISCSVASPGLQVQKVIIDSGRLMPFMSWSRDSSIVIEFAIRNSGVKYKSETYKLPRAIDKREISLFKFSRLYPNGSAKDCLLKKQITIDAHEHKMEVFAPYWIINATDLDLELRPINNIGRDSDVLKQLHCDPLQILPTKHDEMNISVLKSNKSNKTHINTIGHMGTVFCPPSNQDRQSYLLGIKIEQTSFALTTLVKLTPFYYLVNRTDEELEIREVFDGMIELERKSHWIALDPKSKIPFWPLDSRYSKLLVRKARSQFVSEKLTYHSQDQGILLNMGDVEGLYSEVSHNDNECLITFTSYFKGSAAFDIINLTGFAIHYKQDCSIAKYAHLYPAHRILYTWRYPSEAKRVELRIDGKETAKCFIQETGQDAMVLKTMKISEAEVYVIPVFIGTQRTIVVTQDHYHKNRLLHVDKQIIDKEYQIQLRGIGLSLVDSIRREEVGFISVKGTGGIWYQQRVGSRKWRECTPDLTWELESRWRQNKTRRRSDRSSGFRCGNYTVDLGNQTMFSSGKNWTLNRTERQAVDIRYLENESSSSLELSFQSVQIDNTGPAPKWPVVFARVPPKQSVAAVEVADNVAMVYVNIIKDKSHDSNITKYKMFHVLLQECFLQVEVDFVAKILQAFAENSKRGKKLEMQGFRLFMEDLDYATNPVSTEKIVTSSISFFEHMHLSPIRMHFKFSLQYGAEDNILEDLNLLHKLQNLGIGQVAKGEVSLQLSFFQTEYEYFSDNIIRDRIMAHYRFQVIQQLYKFLFGIELLGNPAKVAVDMFSGVKDFFYEPYQGITQSGEAFIEGIGSGTSKLFSGVVGGVTGGFSRLTHNIGSVSAAVTFDKEYQNKRTADNVNNVKGVKEGVARAGEKFFGGLFGGIAGIVEKPISGARQEGAAGFFKGVGKGVTGLVAKPLTGIVDAASISLAGVHSQLETKVQVDRIRYPRVVDEGQLQPYRQRLAYAQHCLRSLQEEEIAAETPLGLGYSDNERIIIVVTSKSICVIDTRTTTGRLKAEFIQDVANANIIYSGDRGQAIIQIRDRQGQIRMVKVRALADLEHLKRAISKNKEISARQEFDTMF